jgi:asparagine synthase (glutamine-hydrolysing)
MAHSIESRVPFLDYRLVEFGLNLKPSYLLNKSVSRPLYRSALSEYLPEAVVNRKNKLGFPVPFNKWTKTCLKNFLIDSFSVKHSPVFDYLDYKHVQNNLKLHFEGKTDYSWELWRILSLQYFLGLKSKVFH